MLLRGEGPLLERVFVNLFENAVKYGDARKKPISVTISGQAQSIEVSVCDQGLGLPSGDPEHLFSKFSRGESESSIFSLGIGLAICKTIIELHGGKITATNSPQGGACFTLHLPVKFS